MANPDENAELGIERHMLTLLPGSRTPVGATGELIPMF
jgi:hypothetical protein